MSCYSYDPDYKLSTCQCDLGDACRTCDCNGNVNECSLLEFGRPVAFEEEKAKTLPVHVKIGDWEQTYSVPHIPINVTGFKTLEE